jgi:serine/threonine protein kinase
MAIGFGLAERSLSSGLVNVMSDLSGKTLLGRYRVEDRLGSGGMGEVYRAYDMQAQAVFALKTLREDFAEDPNFLRRFRKEAQALQALNHPNIVRLYALHEDGLTAFMVLDYIEGSTLRREMRAHGRPFSPGEAQGYLRPITAALGYAHHRGYVHCDMKPANVMIDRHGKVFVADFGIARVSESATITFSTPGTPAYMAPEQWRGGEDVHPATDVYALGVMLYEMLTGYQPFMGEMTQTKGHTREKIMWEHLHVEPPLASALNPRLPKVFDQMLLRCLAKKVADRYASVDDLLKDYEKACGEVQAEVVVPTPIAALSSATSAPSDSGREIQSTARLFTMSGGTVRLVMIGFAILIGLGIVALVFSNTAKRNQPTNTFTPLPQVAVATATTAPLSTDTPQPTATPVPTATQPTIAFFSEQQIAYAYGVVEKSEIYLMNADGSNVRQMTSNQFPDDSPTLSPDGRFLAYASARNDGWELYVLDLATLTETQITNLPDKVRFPSWSPAPGDDRIIFERRSGTGLGIAIWMVRADGSDLQSVIDSGANSRPSWSPDGQRVIFGRALSDNTRDGRITSSDFLDVFIYDFQTRLEQNLTNTPGADDHNMAWSPDGQWIAYASVSSDTNGDGFVNLDDRSDLYVMRSDGSNATNITNGRFSAFSPSWSADSQEIAFVYNLSPGWNEIWVIDREGRNSRRITSGGSYFHPDWSR